MSDLNDKDVEALLGGRAPEGLEPLADLVARIRREASLPADPATAHRHIAAAAATSREAPVPTAVPGSPAPRAWRRKTVFAGLLSTVIGKIMVGAVALAAATAGAGAAGVLGDPVQDFLGGKGDIQRIVDRQQQQLQDQSGDQIHLRDRDRDQLGDQTGTTTQQQHQNGPTATTGQQQGPDEANGQQNQNGQTPTTSTGQQQQQQQQQGQDDEDNATQQQQQQQQGDCQGACGSTTTTTQAQEQQQQQQQGQPDDCPGGSGSQGRP